MLYGNLMIGRNFKVVSACCVKDEEESMPKIYGCTFRKIASSGQNNNAMNIETCEVFTFCHSTDVVAVQQSAQNEPVNGDHQ